MYVIPSSNHGPALRPARSIVFLVKFTAILTILNTCLLAVSLLQRRSDAPERTHVRPLELSKYPNEPISSSVEQGAELTVLNHDEVFQRLEHSEKTLNPNDIFLSVRTTNKYHTTRLKILLDTWISTSPANTWIFTDKKDEWLSQYTEDNFETGKKPTIFYTDCPLSSDHKWALLCKLNWEYRTFLMSEMPWFCHFDDDTFVNVEMLADLLGLFSSEENVYIGRSPSAKPITAMAYDTEKVEPEVMEFNQTTNETDFIMPEVSFERVSFHYALGSAGFCISRRLARNMKQFAFASRLMHTASSISMPDDCVVGYVITHRLNVSLVTTDLMHTHLEDLGLINELMLHKQATLSYSLPADKRERSNASVENAENSVFYYRNATVKDFIIPQQDKPNVVNMKKAYPYEDDPSRFRSLHKLLHTST